MSKMLGRVSTIISSNQPDFSAIETKDFVVSSVIFAPGCAWRIAANAANDMIKSPSAESLMTSMWLGCLLFIPYFRQQFIIQRQCQLTHILLGEIRRDMSHRARANCS